MKKLFLFTLGAFLLSGFQVHAQSPEFNAKLKQMMEISGANAVQRQLPEQMMQMMQQQMQQNGNQLPENTMQQMKVLFDNSFTQLMDLMVPIYAKYYTEEDLDNIIRFYETPSGRRMADAQPKIATMGVAQQWAMQFAQKMGEIFKSAQASEPSSVPGK